MAQLQQLDIPFSHGHFFHLPKNLPGRVNTDDFIFFNIPAGIDASDYTVVVSSIDTSGPPLRTIGMLSESVELPFVHYGAHGKVMVIPTRNPNLPSFFSRLNRGSTYSIPDVRRKHQPGMSHEMIRHGVLTAGVDQ